MKILFDNCTPKPIARSLTGHEIAFARRIGWHEMENGELIQQAEEAGYEVLLSTDKNIRYQRSQSYLPCLQPQLPNLRKNHFERFLALEIESKTPFPSKWYRCLAGDGSPSSLSAKQGPLLNQQCSSPIAE
jgi:PIN like domain